MRPCPAIRSALGLFVLALAGARAVDAQPSATAAPAEAFLFESLEQADRVETDGTQVRTVAMRVRLGNAQGVAAFGQAMQPYVDGYHEVAFEEVEITKPDGRRLPVRNALVEDLNPFGVTDNATPADVRYKKMTIPGLEPGDVIAYRIVTRRKPLSPGRVFGELKLPPVPGGLTQTYLLDIPRRSEIRVRLREGLGASWEEVPSAPDRLVRRLRLQVDLPPEKAGRRERESWIEPDVMFSSFTSWADVTRWWWDLSKPRLQANAAVAAEAARVVSGATSAAEKMAALHAFVGQRIRYQNVSFGLGRMQPRPAADVLANRYGDCKDKHALLGAMAASVGLDVRPVLVHSGGVDLRDDVPGPQQFDHMISVVRLGATPAEWIWLDTTNPYAGPGHLIPGLRDEQALLVEPDGGATIVRTPKDPPFVPAREMSLKGRLAPDGALQGRVTWVLRADSEPALRAVFAAVPQERRSTAVQEGFASRLGDVAIDNVSVSDPLEVSKPLTVEFDVKAKPEAARRSLKVPVAGVDLPKPDASPAPGEPVATFPLREVVARGEVELPEGVAGRAPLSVSLDRPFGTFRSTYSVEGRTLKVERRLTLKQDTLAAADVAAYEAFRNAVEKDEDQEFAIEGRAAGAGGAAVLRAEGTAAFEKKDYATAVDLLRQATTEDPKVEDGFRDLGRALYELRRDDEAVAAFTRQIEAAPFHEDAYSWRAHVLARLNRWDEAEKDLEKQIEVAPFKVWPYEKLAERRRDRGRLDEAADLFARAAALEPRKAERWVDLGEVQARAGRADEARRSLETAAGLDPVDWMKLRVAQAYQTLGDVAKAGMLAEAAAPSLARHTANLAPARVDEGDLFWTNRLADAWHLVGLSAVAAGDTVKGDRYLDAAWRLGFAPEVAWALGELREKQGKLAQAVDLWAMAAAVPSSKYRLPPDGPSRLAAAIRKLPEPPATTPRAPLPPGRSARQDAATAHLMDLRTVRVPGSVTSDFAEDVLVLTDLEGRIERIVNVSRRSQAAFDRQVPKLGVARVDVPRPDGQPVKALRRALLACSAASGCALVLDLPGVGKVRKAGDTASIRIVSIEPERGVTLAPGQTVAVRVRVHYQGVEGLAVVSLGAADQAGTILIPQVNEPVRTASGDLEMKGTFVVPPGARQVDVVIAFIKGEGSDDTVLMPTRYAVSAP